MQYLVAFGFMSLIVAMFVVTYLMNKNTERPDVELDDTSCGGCLNVGCGHHPAHNNKEGM